MGESGINSIPTDGGSDPQRTGGQHDRQAWVRANFTQIFGTSAEDLQRQGINPRQYAREHRDQIRQFAQMQRRQGIAVPSGRPGFGVGMRGGSAWIGILLVLFAVRFLLVDSLVGTHAAIFWVLGIGGIMLIARVFLFSWLRKRRFSRRQAGGQPSSRSGF